MTNVNTVKAMLNAVTNSFPLAILSIDATTNKISDLFISKQTKHNFQYLINKNVFHLAKLLFGTSISATIKDTFFACFHSKKLIELPRIKHTNAYGLVEYFNFNFYTTPESSDIIVVIFNTTETVLLEEEFTCMAEQYELVNRELSVSMSKLDFHLMDIEQAHKRVAALYKITSIAQKTVNQEEVLEEILDGISREFGYANASIFLLDEHANNLKITAPHANNLAANTFAMGEGIIGAAALQRELVYEDNTFTDSDTSSIKEVAVPLIVDDEVLGVLHVEVAGSRELQPYDFDLLRSLSTQIAMTLAHANHVAKVEIQAITDGMTELYNYRYFVKMLHQEFKRAIRYKRPLALFIIDIDHFKKYNDTNGHLMGDKILFEVATLIKRTCRDTDFAFRYGGEEFVVLLPETRETEAVLIAERLRTIISRYKFPNCETQPGGMLTVSIGIAGFPDGTENESNLINYADIALYWAKKARNTCCLYSQEIESTIVNE